MRTIVRTTREGAVLTVTLEGPKRLNALGAVACHELSAIWDMFEADDGLRVAIITGTGRAFCAGHDLDDDLDAPMPASGWAGLSRRSTLDKPIIAAVNGLAFGGGWEVALACDIVVADEGATFALPEPKVGLVALGGGATLLPNYIPWHIAMRYLLSGETLDARTAHKWGLVSDVAPAGEVMRVTRRYADAILAGAPTAIRATKAIARAAVEPHRRQEELYRLESHWLQRLLPLDDTREGTAAFKEKRPPRWSGR